MGLFVRRNESGGLGRSASPSAKVEYVVTQKFE